MKIITKSRSLFAKSRSLFAKSRSLFGISVKSNNNTAYNELRALGL